MARTAIIRSADSTVTNVIELSASSAWSPPAGHTVVPDPSNKAQIGGTWDGTAFGDPVAPTPTPEEAQFSQDRRTIRSFMQAANGTATAAQRDAFLKAFVRAAAYKIGQLEE